MMTKHRTRHNEENNLTIDFSAVLAAAVHDMKSSLNMLQQSIEQLDRHITADNSEATQCLSTAHYESSRVNTGLVQILSLYRAEMENLPIQVDECFIEDLFDTISLTHERYIERQKMHLQTEVDEDLAHYLDSDLVLMMLNDIVANAVRYGVQKIRIGASKQDGWLVIKVEDDGKGYPERMLITNDVEMQDFNIREGRTGLGIFFAKLIACAHTRGDCKGSIHLANGGDLGGSVFTLKLP